MIPLQVRIKGLMRYREEQVADFTDGSLIAICGDNGAGKSSIFDAITFALYGHSLRVNAHATQELISEDEGYLSVSFDFEEGPDRFRVQRVRAANRGRSTFALQRWDPESDIWLLIPGTDSATGLQAALGKLIKLSDQAFTSSYLLGQDAATLFIDMKPNERFQTIASLIGLDEYEAMARTAGRLAANAQTIVKDRVEQLHRFAGVDETALDALLNAAKQAHKTLDQSTKAAADARGRAQDAATYARLQAEIDALAAQIEAASLLLAGQDAIEASARRFEELARLIDLVTTIGAELALAAEAETSAAQTDAATAGIDLAGLEAALAEVTEAGQEVAAALAEAEQDHANAALDERQAHEFRIAATAVLDGRRHLAELQGRLDEYQEAVATLPARRAEAQRLEAVKLALVPLGEWRSALLQVESLAGLEPAARHSHLDQQAQDLATEIETLTAGITTLGDAAAASVEAVSQAAAELRGLLGHLEQRQASAQEAVCSHCGQPIDPGTAQAEIEDLQRQITAARKRLTAAESEKAAAQAAIKAAQTALREQEALLHGLETDLATAAIQVEQLRAAEANAAARAQAFHAAAPPDLAATLADAPTAATLTTILANHEGIAAQAAAAQTELAALQRLEGELMSTQRQWRQATEALEAALALVVGRQDEVDSAADAHDAAKAGLDAAERDLIQLRSLATQATSTLNLAREALDAARDQHRRLQAEAAQHHATAAAHQRTAGLLAASLDEDLRPEALANAGALLARFDAERSDLADAPQRLAALRQAQSDHASLSGQRQAKLAEAAKVPAAHRIDPAAAEIAAQEAATAVEAASAALQAAQAAVTLLTERLAQKQALEDDRARAERRHYLLRKLSVLLSKSGLQGVLVTGALQEIASHANSFLARLTGGNLELILDKSQTSDELDLQALDHSAMRQARNIQALSGSQKFRCAVALAFGIGQYAGAGGMRSIMIDEGFGGLDESGQQQMVEELKNLAGHMDKVIVVSHLEAFRDRDNFPHQIHVLKSGNGSIIQNVVS